MPVITFNEVVYKSKQLLGCRIRKDMNGNEIICALSYAISDIENFINLDGVKITDINVDKCSKDGKNLLTRILNALISADSIFSTELATIKTQIQTLIDAGDLDTDEKVKTNSTDGVSGYLQDKVYSDQAGCVSVKTEILSGVENKKLLLMGFIPVGGLIYVDASRVGDLDNTGKGKVNTDLWGFALSNGQNGTRNRLGKFVRNIDTLANAGNSGGSASFTVAKENISSYDLAVAGSISDALVDDIMVPMKFDTNKLADGSGGSVNLLRLGTGQSGAQTMNGKFNAKHTHSFTLSSKHINATPTPIPLIPEFMYEIPLVRIF